MEDMKFDMGKIAEKLNVSLQEAHEIVQKMLFKKGLLGKVVGKMFSTTMLSTYMLIDMGK